MVAESRPPHILAEWTEQDLVRIAALERELVDTAEREPETIPFALDKLVLGAKFELPGFEALADVLSEEALGDALPAVGEAIFGLDLVGLPASFVISRPRINGAMLLDRKHTLLNLR
jgi:hypothetical protein